MVDLMISISVLLLLVALLFLVLWIKRKLQITNLKKLVGQRKKVIDDLREELQLKDMRVPSYLEHFRNIAPYSSEAAKKDRAVVRLS